MFYGVIKILNEKSRKVLILVLSLLMIPTPVYAENGSDTEITTKWYSEIVSNMLAKGVISDTAGLEEPLTRGNMADILIATGKFSDNSYAVNPFSDLSTRGKEYYNIMRLYNSHVFVGSVDQNGNLVAQANGLLTREQAAAFIVRAFNLEGTTENLICNFKDKQDISEYALGNILICEKLNLISGYEDGTFKPQNNISKIEFLTILNKVFEYGLDSNVNMQNLETTFYDKYKSSAVVLNADINIKRFKLNLEFENKSDFVYSYGMEFQIEKLEEGKWIVVPFEKRKDIDDSAFLINPNAKKTDTVFLEDYYNELDNGTYRIVYALDKQIYSIRKSFSDVEFCAAEFEIL
ncbi:MAG: S-layer homology domain-containing protein [Clostridiales bacterium]|nr:S-layer homology domain-containing protein [Clostridiales bacterium]